MSIKFQRKAFNFLVGMLLAIMTLQFSTLALVSYGLLRAIVCVLFCLLALATALWVVTPIEDSKRRKCRK